MKRFFQKLLGSKSQPASLTPRHKRKTLRSFEVLEDRRLTVIGALGDALPTGTGQWVDGVVKLQTNSGSQVFTGSGALLADGRHILTAAHCLKDEDTGNLFNEVRVTFELPGGAPPIVVPKANFRIHEKYQPGENDIAILVLPQLAPAAAPRYDLYTAGDEVGQTFLMVGYGQTGNGTTGATGASGTRRFGYNRINSVDASETVLNFDFDNPNTDPTAIGPNESNLAPGDSGGPIFLGNRIAGVMRSGDGDRNFGFHEVSRVTRAYAYAAWIDGKTGMGNPDVVLDMNKLAAGNNGSPDTIEARMNGENMELFVNGGLVLSKTFCRVGTLTIIGSNDNDTIKVDGRLGLPLNPVDGRGGHNKLEIDDRAGAYPSYDISESLVSTTRWQVGMNAIQDLTLYTSHKASNVNVLGLPGGLTTVYGGNSADTFNVGRLDRSLDALAASDEFRLFSSLEIVGGAGTDNLTIYEGPPPYIYGSTATAFTIRDSNIFRSRTQPNYYGWRPAYFRLSTDYSGIENLRIAGGDVGNHFTVKSVSSSTVVKLDGGNGADTFAVGDSQNSLDSIRGLKIDGKSGHDVLTFVDTAPPAYQPIAQDQPTYVLTSSYLRWSQWVRLNLNKPGAQIESTYNYSGIEALSLWGSHLGGLYNIQSAADSANVKVHGGSGDDTFLSTSLYDVQGVTIDGGQGVDRAFLDDHGNPARESGPVKYAVGPTYVQLTGENGPIATVNFLLNGQNPGTPGHLEELTLFTSEGDDLVDIYGTWAGLPVAVHMGQGNDQATLQNWGPWVLGSDLMISGDADYDRLFVKDALSNVSQTYEITANTIGRAGAIPVRHDALESVELNAGNQDDVFNVYGTLPGLTTINAGEGNDSFHLQDYAGTLDSLQGWLHLDGQAGDYNSLYLNDGLNPVGQTYSIDAGGIHRSGVASVTYAKLQLISLMAGLGDDVFAFGHTEGGMPIYFDGNAGRDTLDYSHYDADVFVDLASWIATDTAWAANFENVLGGNGNDQLFGDDNDNLLLGGPGIDLLEGRGGRDILIGGLDADMLLGGSDDDLLIGGSTVHDANLAALLAIANEWSRRELSYAERVDHLRGLTEGGLNGTALLTPETILADLVDDALEGSDGLDWFFGDSTEIADLLAEEFLG